VRRTIPLREAVPDRFSVIMLAVADGAEILYVAHGFPWDVQLRESPTRLTTRERNLVDDKTSDSIHTTNADT